MNFTKLPNIIFDEFLPDLTNAELKLLLIIYRQTIGWKNQFTGKRKERDRITYNQFMQKTGLSRRILSQAITSLAEKNLIAITDFEKNNIRQSKHRKGKTYIFYQPMHIPVPSYAITALNQCKKGYITKEKRN